MMLHIWEDRSQPRVLHVRDSTKLQVGKSHAYVPRHCSVESGDKKIRQFEAAIIETEAAARDDPRRMEIFVGQRNIRAGIASAPLELACAELRFSAQIHLSRRNHGLPQRVAKVQQVHPPAVPEIPLRIHEAVHFCLCVQVGSARCQHALFQGKSLAPQ